MPDHSVSKEIFPVIRPEPRLAQPEAISPYPVVCCVEEEMDPDGYNRRLFNMEILTVHFLLCWDVCVNKQTLRWSCDIGTVSLVC